MNHNKSREDEFQLGVTGNRDVEEDSGRNRMSNDELRELLHQQVVIL